MEEIVKLDKWLPQRPPILVIEKVIELVPGQSGKGIKTFRETDTFFQGHFPAKPILPGIYLVEAFAQTASVVLLAGFMENVGNLHRDLNEPVGYLAGVDEMRFHKIIEPDQKIEFAVEVSRSYGKLYVLNCKATRHEEVCARGTITLFLEAAAINRPFEK